jgi:hypothetical protein
MLAYFGTSCLSAELFNVERHLSDSSPELGPWEAVKIGRNTLARSDNDSRIIFCATKLGSKVRRQDTSHNG